MSEQGIMWIGLPIGNGIHWYMFVHKYLLIRRYVYNSQKRVFNTGFVNTYYEPHSFSMLPYDLNIYDEIEKWMYIYFPK
jgi:hypothetical protein